MWHIVLDNWNFLWLALSELQQERQTETVRKRACLLIILYLLVVKSGCFLHKLFSSSSVWLDCSGPHSVVTRANHWAIRQCCLQQYPILSRDYGQRGKSQWSPSTLQCIFLCLCSPLQLLQKSTLSRFNTLALVLVLTWKALGALKVVEQNLCGHKWKKLFSAPRGKVFWL